MTRIDALLLSVQEDLQTIDNKIQGLQASLDGMTAQQQELNKELVRLQEQYDSVTKELETTNEERFKLSAQIAPITRLIPELLSSIFEHVVGTDTSQATCFPIQASEVSALWRQVILNTPRAWSYISLDIESDETVAPRRRRAAAFLERSKHTDIRINVELYLWGGATDRNGSRSQLFEVLLPHMDRCTAFSFRPRYSEDIAPLFDTLGPKMGPSLLEFSINSNRFAICNIPVLESVTNWTLTNVRPGDWATLIRPSLQTLSITRVSSLVIESFIAALKAAAGSLEVLELVGCTFIYNASLILFSETGVISEGGTFPKLRRLVFDDLKLTEIDILWSLISAPALRELRLALQTRLRYFRFMERTAFNGLAKRAIRRLELVNVDIEGSEITTFLDLLKCLGNSLEELFLECRELDNRIFEALAAYPELTPNLRSLEIIEVNSITGQEVLQLAHSRLARRLTVKPLQVVDIRCCGSFEQDFSLQLKQIVPTVHYTPDR